MEPGKLRENFECCFRNWIAQQHEDLEELVDALASNRDDEDSLRLLASKGIKHFADYRENRASLSKHNPSSFLCPSWCSDLENSFLWLGGCRPSLSIRLVYCLCGSELNIDTSQLNSSSYQIENQGDLADISSDQLILINSLHMKIIKEEEKLSGRMTSLQEEIADDPLAIIAKRARQVGEMTPKLLEALQGHSLSLQRILVDADKLRLSTVEELVSFLTPLQTADFLMNAKKLHLSMHEWGKRRQQEIMNTMD